MFVVKNSDRAKRIATALRTKLLEHGHSITHLQALELTANMYGHKNWREMEAQGKKSRPSSYDEEVLPQVVTERRHLQISALLGAGIKETVVHMVLNSLKPTGRRSSHDSHRLSSDDADRVIIEAREMADSGKLTEAAKTLLSALRFGPKAQRPQVMTEMEFLSQTNTNACFYLGMSHLLGDAPDGRDVEKARVIMERCVGLHVGDEVSAEALCVLGDIAGGNHGGPDDEAKATGYYTTAALTGLSELGAFNSGLHHANEGRYDLAARFYSLGIKLENAACMTNYALLILNGHLNGTRGMMMGLLQIASRLGDDKATSALRTLHI